MPVLTKFKRQKRLMGSQFEFIILADAEHGESFLDDGVAEVVRIEKLLTEFSEDSQTMLINRMAGKPAIQIEEEIYRIIQRANQISSITQGAFDITASLLKKLYNFKGQTFVMPSDDEIAKALQKVGYEKIELLGHNHIRLATGGMHLGFGAMGKGYAADCVRRLLINKGVENGVINASGDLTAWGKADNDNPWKVGIADPDNPGQYVCWLPICNSSVATSGNYEQYFEYKGERYSHTINPRTGRPTQGIKSVTVLSASAELSDALATAVSIMGEEVGLHFIEQLPGVHALIINDQNGISFTKQIGVIQHEHQEI